MLARVALVLLLTLSGACGGDDGSDGDVGDAATETSAPAATGTEAPTVPSGATPECDTIQVLLKLDIDDGQRDDVASVLDGIDGVEHELVEAESATEPSMFLVTAESVRASTAVGSELSGHPAVVSVVFPEQLC